MINGMDWLTSAGFGLDRDRVRLIRANQQWIEAGARLRDRVADELSGLVADVEHVGSSSVLGLLAKPIVDIVAGLAGGQALAPVHATLAVGGWTYRGDSGADGGHLFVLEARPGHRLAHLHVVDRGGEQWLHYVRLRDLLRRSPEARARYESVKRHLHEEVGDDRKAYTDGKADVVRQLLQADC
jgi:GrpB-like predicted nucleotidyltransferase (UPF0157 family)